MCWCARTFDFGFQRLSECEALRFREGQSSKVHSDFAVPNVFLASAIPSRDHIFLLRQLVMRPPAEPRDLPPPGQTFRQMPGADAS
jgi:hypothetical protein